MEAHPDGEVFFAEDVDGEEDTAEVFAEIFWPVLADVVELTGERVGRGEQGGAEGVEEAPDFGGDGRAGGEVVGKGRGNGLVDRLLFEGSVLEEFAEGVKAGLMLASQRRRSSSRAASRLGRPSVVPFSHWAGVSSPR
ncbi:hypothetical protein [Tunturiibacter gelidiferens]|uniref:hypothetical protein n=1 Tax=Tunturiibacter gelidiferens TaxID=3069689 RepID=UPI003D9B1E34